MLVFMFVKKKIMSEVISIMCKGKYKKLYDYVSFTKHYNMGESE